MRHTLNPTDLDGFEQSIVIASAVSAHNKKRLMIVNSIKGDNISGRIAVLHKGEKDEEEKVYYNGQSLADAIKSYNQLQ